MQCPVSVRFRRASMTVQRIVQCHFVSYTLRSFRKTHGQNCCLHKRNRAVTVFCCSVRNNTTPEAKRSMPKRWSNASSLFSLSPMHLHFSTVPIAMAWSRSPRSYPRKSKRQHRVRSKLPQIPRRQRVCELRSLWSSA